MYDKRKENACGNQPKLVWYYQKQSEKMTDRIKTAESRKQKECLTKTISELTIAKLVGIPTCYSLPSPSHYMKVMLEQVLNPLLEGSGKDILEKRHM